MRILTVVDAFTHECRALETDTSIGSLRVVRVLKRIIAQRGAPRRIRGDSHGYGEYRDLRRLSPSRYKSES